MSKSVLSVLLIICVFLGGYIVTMWYAHSEDQKNRTEYTEAETTDATEKKENLSASTIEQMGEYTSSGITEEATKETTHTVPTHNRLGETETKETQPSFVSDQNETPLT